MRAFEPCWAKGISQNAVPDLCPYGKPCCMRSPAKAEVVMITHVKLCALSAGLQGFVATKHKFSRTSHIPNLNKNLVSSLDVVLLLRGGWSNQSGKGNLGPSI